MFPPLRQVLRQVSLQNHEGYQRDRADEQKHIVDHEGVNLSWTDDGLCTGRIFIDRDLRNVASFLNLADWPEVRIMYGRNPHLRRSL
jgi:hypothetical protein